MSSFEQFQETRERYATEYNRQNKSTKCEKCGGEWFKEIEVGKYLANQSAMIGQRLRLVNENDRFFMLECLKCQNIQEPKITRTGKDMLNKEYDKFLDEVEKLKASDKIEEVHKKKVITDEV